MYISNESILSTTHISNLWSSIDGHGQRLAVCGSSMSPAANVLEIEDPTDWMRQVVCPAFVMPEGSVVLSPGACSEASSWVHAEICIQLSAHCGCTGDTTLQCMCYFIQYLYVGYSHFGVDCVGKPSLVNRDLEHLQKQSNLVKMLKAAVRETLPRRHKWQQTMVLLDVGCRCMDWEMWAMV